MSQEKPKFFNVRRIVAGPVLLALAACAVDTTVADVSPTPVFAPRSSELEKSQLRENLISALISVNSLGSEEFARLNGYQSPAAIENGRAILRAFLEEVSSSRFNEAAFWQDPSSYSKVAYLAKMIAKNYTGQASADRDKTKRTLFELISKVHKEALGSGEPRIKTIAVQAYSELQRYVATDPWGQPVDLIPQKNFQ